ncbi:MAG: hypothetical protein ACTSO9_10980 [Candidatus Helarchaeota archaeon]
MIKEINKLQVLNCNYTDTVLASEIGRKLKLLRRIVGIDAIFAAIAINNGCEVIITRNTEHFN